ncbi:hypothetical protein PENTCL1PPCAC_15745, partial [Pristionchus entomophagus]
RTLLSLIEENVPMMKKQIHKIDPSEEELLALIGLAFWSVESFETTDLALEMAARYRTKIMSELTARYRRTIGDERGASRIGILLCLLQEFRRAVLTVTSSFEIFHMLGVADENSIILKL